MDAQLVEQKTIRILLGVMSNPTSPRLRNQLREWNSKFAVHRHGVDVQYVLGSEFYGGANGSSAAPVPAEAIAGVQTEEVEHNDLFYVSGRERLPHVGVVTEKSAAFWRESGAAMPDYDFYCKSDDDTMVHLDRLHAVLGHITRVEGPSRPVYLGHMKWRGWDVGFRFQACGGTWGNAVKTGNDILYGGTLPGDGSYEPCPHAAGPYPYMSGGMVCMSRALQRIVAADASFGAFLTVAKARNDMGERCRRPQECAAQPANTHMWHHEDAGIGFNVFRAVVYANASASIIPVPGHFNDPSIIERSPSAQDLYWSSRALFVHGIKQRSHYDIALQRWQLTRSSDHLTLRCNRNCSTHGVEGYAWEWARLPCPPRRWSDARAPRGRFCHVEPQDHYRCCSWPWVVPQLRTVILKVLAGASGQRMHVAELVRKARREAAASAIDRPGCIGACASVEVPQGMHMHAVLEDLARRGDLSYSAANREQAGEGREVWLEPVR